MNTPRRRSHHAQAEHRADTLGDLLARTLRSYAFALDMHPCESCATDLEILVTKAREAGIADLLYARDEKDAHA